MNRFCVFIFLLLSNVSSLYCLTSQQIKDQYSLIIKVNFRNDVCFAIIPGNEIVDKEDQMELPKSAFKYDKNAWDEVCQLWSDVSKPEDVGCYLLSNNFVDVPNGKATCSIKISSPHESDFKCSVCFDKALKFSETILVRNDFLAECLFFQKNKEVQMKAQSQPVHSFDNLDIEFDADEIASYQKSNKPAKIMVYARQFGTVLLMRYLALKNYLVDTWYNVKNVFA